MAPTGRGIATVTLTLTLTDCTAAPRCTLQSALPGEGGGRGEI